MSRISDRPPKRRAVRHLRTLRSLLSISALLLMVSTTCAAPASRPATGAIADQVRAALASGSAGFDHSAWNGLLAASVHDGRVDYPYLQDHRAELDAYLQRIAEANLATLSRDALEALLIDAYNALTVASILDHWPVDSIRDIDGVWDTATHTVGGHELTLDAIEHNLLRPFFKDPRIHFAVNCASASCAPLPSWAYTGEDLEHQLDERARSFLSDPENVAIDGDALRVSKYFDWYGEDFTREGWQPRADTIPGFIARYTRPEVAAFIEQHGGNPELRFFDYDWSLNSVANGAAGGS